MKWKIFENGTLIDMIVADEDFCRTYCADFNYTYELIPEEEPDPPRNEWIATRDYEPGELLTIEKTLYKVLLPVFASAPFTVGTNVEATIIESEIANLNKEES